MNMQEVEQIVEAIGTIKSKADRKRVIDSLVHNEKLEIGDRFWISQRCGNKVLLSIDVKL